MVFDKAMNKTIAVCGLVTVLCAQSAVAQLREVYPAPPRGTLGLSFQVGQAVGQFHQYVNVGGGGGGYLLFRPWRDAPLGFRFHVMYLVYGSQTHRYPLVPGIAVDVTTRNQIAQVSLGPQVTLGRGPLQVYGFAAFGGSFFSTTSSVEGSDPNSQQFASTTNYEDGTAAGEFGGGLLIRLSQRAPIAIDLGARYLNNGRVTYVTKERVRIVNNQLLVNPVDSKANLIVYHLGVAIGLRRHATLDDR
jgi:hypothetical protein